MNPYAEVVVSDIERPRASRLESGAFKEFLESIAVGQEGELIQAPVIVRKSGGKFQLLAGAARLAAVRKLGQTKVWCRILPTLPDTPRAKLAFIDENLMRLNWPKDVADKWHRERVKLLAEMDPARSPEARRKEAQVKGGKTGGRGRPKLGPPGGPSYQKPSKQPKERKAQEAEHRASAPETVQELYSAGKLTQKQMDLLVTIRSPAVPEEVALAVQEEVAQEVAGKTVAQTREVVKVAKEKLKGTPEAQFAGLVVAIGELEKVCGQAQARADVVIRLAEEFGLEAVGGLSGRVSFTSVFLAYSALGRVAEIFNGGNHGKSQKGGEQRLLAQSTEAQ